MPESTALRVARPECTNHKVHNKEGNQMYNSTDHTSGVLGFTSQNTPNFNQEDI